MIRRSTPCSAWPICNWGMSPAVWSCWNEVAAAKPDDAATKLDLALAYLRAKQSQKASALLRSMPHVDGDGRRERLLIAAAAGEGGVNAAKTRVEQLLREQPPDDIRTLNVAGTILCATGEFERSRALLATALAAQPKDIETLLNSAAIEFAAAKYQRCLRTPAGRACYRSR